MKTGKLVILGAVFTGIAVPQQPKKAIEIEPFDYSSVMTAVQAIFGTQMNVGQGIQAMMTTRVQKGGKFTVVERRKIATALKEQDFDASNRVKRGTGARIGQVRGADLSLAGDIVVFGRDDRHRGAGGAGFSGGTGAAIGGYKNDAKAVVVLDYRIIDMETSEVVATGEARGESKRSSKGFGAALLVGWTGGGGGANMGSSNFAETIIGEATMDAVNKLAEQIEGQTLQGGAESRANDLDARVADVSGNSITINAGAAAGLQAGMTFTIYHKGKEIKDPTTGEVLDVQVAPLGQLTITTVREKIAIGNFSGSGAPAVGDIVRK